MPLLINNATGLAEDLDQTSADVALRSQSHEIPLNDPNGNPVTAPLEQAQTLLGQGYTQPTPDQLQGLANYAKYSTPSEQIKTGLEGAAEAATFGLSSGVERVAGVSPEAMRARKEANPNAYMAGQVAGLAGTALIPGLGEANLLKDAGEGVAAAVGLGEVAEAGLGAKIASQAVKGATETALLQSGDEISRMFQSDPDQTVQSALADIGLSGVIGAGVGGTLGSVSPLWKSAQESKLGQALLAIKNKATAIESGALPTAESIAAEHAGLALTPEMKAAIGEDPTARQLFQELREGATKSGEKARQAEESLYSNAQNALVSALGKTPEDLEAISGKSKFDSGNQIKETLSTELKKIVDPISEQFEKYKGQFAGAEFGATRQAHLENALGRLIQEEGLHTFPDMPQAKLVNNILEGVKRFHTMEDLSKAQTIVRQNTQNPELWHIGKKLVGVLREAEEKMTTDLLAEKAPQAIAEHASARASYKQAMELIDNLNDRLHVGRYAGPSSFISALKEMAPEDVLRRITSTKDAGLLSLLKETLPETGALVKDAHLNNLLGQAVQRAPKDQLLGTKALFSNIEKNWSPELKEFALPAGADKKISSIQSVLESIPQRINPSGTARTLDALMSQVPAGLMSTIGTLMGHSPVGGFILGALGRLVGREVPDAVKLATLKFLGSGQPISSEAFKTAVELIASTIKGEHLMNRAVKNVFASSKDVLPLAMIPKPDKLERLDKKLKEYRTNPDPLMDVGGKAPYYLPDHGRAMGNVAANATQYLNSIRPATEKSGVLDNPRKPSVVEESKYNRALLISEQPLVVLHHIKAGTLTSEDVSTLKSLYPGLYSRLNQKLTNEVIELSNKGEHVPYRTRLGLSLFMGQPLDSSMSPQSIQMNQSLNQKAPSGPQTMPVKNQKHSMAAMSKLPGSYQTIMQGREADRAQKS
jgi:hypothetical protein